MEQWSVPEKGDESEATSLQQIKFGQNEQKHPDVILKCGDVRIAANRKTLAGGSLYFAAMFKGNFTESYAPEIEIHEIIPLWLIIAIDFIYTGHLDISENNMQQLFVTASFLQMKCMEDKCCDYIVSRLNVKSCLEINVLAKTHNNVFLRKKCMHFITKNFESLVKRTDFYKLSVDEVSEILEYLGLKMYFEDIKLRALARWADYKPDERLKNFTHLLKYIDPYAITTDDARSLKIFERDETCQNWLKNAESIHNNTQCSVFVLKPHRSQSLLHRLNIIPQAITQLEPLPARIYDYSLAAYKHFLFACGGHYGDISSFCSRKSYSYNIYHNEWYEWRPLLAARHSHRSAVLQDNLYNLGGITRLGCCSSVECLNLPTNIALNPPSLLEDRRLMGSVVRNDTLYIMGGLRPDGTPLRSMERFDPRQNIWEKLPSMLRLTDRCRSAIINDSIYCTGTRYHVQRFDLRANKWILIELSDATYVFDIFAENNRLYGISTDGICLFNEEARRWSMVAPIAIENCEEAKIVSLQMPQ